MASLFDYRVDGVTYTRQQFEAHRRADERARELAEWAAEDAAERAAELAAERYYEERGYEDARAQEYYEMQMGIPA